MQLLSDIGEKIANFFGDDSYQKKRKETFQGSPFSDILPYDSYDQTTGIFFGKESMGFAIEAAPMVGADESTQEEILEIFRDAMEEGSSLQCLLWADHRTGNFFNGWKRPRAKTSEIYSHIAERRIKFLKGNPKVSPRIFRFILSYSVPAKDGDNASLIAIKEKILKSINNLTYAREWNAQDLISALDGLINFQLSPEVVERTWSPYESIGKQIPTGGTIEVNQESIVWKGSAQKSVAFKSLRVIDYPDTWSIGAMHRLIGDLYKESYRVSVPFLIHYGVHCPIQDKEERGFKSRMLFIENQGKSGALLRLVPQLREELQELDFVRRTLSQGNRFVYTQLGVGIWSAPEQLSDAVQSIKSLFRLNQFVLSENDSVHLPMFLSYLPISWAEYVQDFKNLNLLKTTIATESSNFVPLQGEWMGTPTPGVLLTGRRGQLLNWNPFDNQSGNYNAIVVGRSGMGKSVFMQELLTSTLGTGGKVFVIEVGRSFEKMCDACEGQYIEFSKETQLCLNPFSGIPENDPEERDHLFSMLKSVIATMAAPTDGTGDYENALIEKAIYSVWEKTGSNSTITNIAHWLQSQKDKKAQGLGIMLTPYTSTGMYGRYFEGKNNIDFKKPFVLVELEELKEKKDLQAVVLQMFIMTITNQAFLGDRKTPFHICIDEAWDLLRGGQSGPFIETLARRLRKYNGSLVIGTQSIEDFYSTPGALAAFENSDWMCLLGQKKASIKRLQESGKIDLDDQKSNALESVHTQNGEYSEVMICDGEGNYSIARLHLDPFSQLLYTTKASQYAEIKDLRNQGLSITDAIERIINGK